MSKNSVDAYGAKGKTNLLMFDPDDLVLVVDPKSPLYDERVHLPVSEPMVLNIRAKGVLQPIVVAKNPETGQTEVVAGRQRVKAAREANRRLRAEGLEPVQVSAVVRRATGVEAADVMVSENELRESDTPLGRARKMGRLMQLGRSEDQLAIVFGCTVATVRNTLALLECSAAVRNAVEAGKIGVGHARKLSQMTAEEQREKVAELAAAADSSTGRERARKQRQIVSGDEAAPRMRTRKEIVAERDASTGERRAALEWVLGVTGQKTAASTTTLKRAA